MNWYRAGWPGVGSDSSLAARCLGLCGAMVLVAVPVTWIAFEYAGQSGATASLVAAVCCLIGSLIPLALSKLLHGQQYTLHHLLLGMLFRMGIPLGLALISQVKGWPLDKRCFLLALVAYFWVGLVFDTRSALSGVRPTNSATRMG